MKQLVFFLCVLLIAPYAYAGEVRVWEDTIALPTYVIYGSDFNPHFYDLEGSIIYPYTMQDDLGDDKIVRTYRTVCLENDYLKIICLPQIGGRIHSVFDKTTNREMFHRNDVIKPGLIAMRGAWISGGIEWNRGPQGHTVTSFSPVDVTSRVNPDGSASLIIGDIEKIFRTRWNVVLTLHPDKAYLDEQIGIYNPTDGLHSYYFWNNTAFPCKPGTRFIYPMKLGQDHAGTTFFSWPIDKGKDITWLKNYDRPSSVFAYRCAFDFFGAYDIDDDRGIVQFGDHHVLTGKKAWTWGQSGDGIASERALHDDNSQYIEVQSGPLQTQADYGLIGPRQKLAWQEWWYPVHGLGDGFEYATKDIAIQTKWPEEGEGTLEVRMLATGNCPGAVCSIMCGATPTVTTLDLSPKAAATVRVAARKADTATIDVRTATGIQLAHYVSPLDIPDRTPPDLTPKDNPSPAVEELYLEGVKHEERIQPGPAREAYEKCIASDPGHAAAHVALARLDYGRGSYARAADHALKATNRDPGSCMAWYYLGLALLEMPGHPAAVDPIDAAYKVLATLDNPLLGHDLAGKIRMRNKEYPDAIREFEMAVAVAPDDSVANDHLIAALHAAGNTAEACRRASQRIAADPLDFIPRAIASLTSARDIEVFCEFLKQTSGKPDFDLKYIVQFLADLGLFAEAYDLAKPFYDTPVPNVIGVLYAGEFPDTRLRAGPWYLLGWLAHMTNNNELAIDYLHKGKEQVPHYAFPSEPRDEAIYQYAISVDPNDANAHLILGNLLACEGKLDEAALEWQRATETGKPYSVSYRNLAMYSWKKENDLAKASGLFQKAIAACPLDQTLYRDAANALIAEKKRPQAITLLETMPLDHPRRGDVTVLLAQSYNEEKRYDDALALLEGSKFSNWELNTATWQAFHRAHIERGKLDLDAKKYESALDDFAASLTYPEYLGVGRSAKPEESEALYWKGRALDALGRKDEARAAWTAGAAGTEKSDIQKDFVKRCKEALGA